MIKREIKLQKQEKKFNNTHFNVNNDIFYVIIIYGNLNIGFFGGNNEKNNAT